MNDSVTSRKPRRPSIKRGVRKETIDKVAARMEAADKATVADYLVSQIPLSSIIIWDEQPRELSLTIDDVIRGRVEEHDPLYDQKENELSGIATLALSIRDTGMNNPPIAYGLPGQRVQLIGGQRRTMAMIYSLFHVVTESLDSGGFSHDITINENPELERIENTRIPVKVYTRKPDALVIEKIGMADNLYEELPVKDKLEWALRYADKKALNNKSLHWGDLTGTIGMNRAQAFRWVKVIGERHDPWVAKGIELVKAEKLSFSKLIEIAYAEDREGTFNSVTGQKRLPVDGPKKYSLGAKTTNLKAVKELIFANVDAEARSHFEKIDWENPGKVKKAFATFFELWEQKIG